MTSNQCKASSLQASILFGHKGWIRLDQCNTWGCLYLVIFQLWKIELYMWMYRLLFCDWVDGSIPKMKLPVDLELRRAMTVRDTSEAVKIRVEVNGLTPNSPWDEEGGWDMLTSLVPQHCITDINTGPAGRDVQQRIGERHQITWPLLLALEELTKLQPQRQSEPLMMVTLAHSFH